MIKQEDIRHDIDRLLELRARLVHIEELEIEFKALTQTVDRLSRQSILGALTLLFTELGKREYGKQRKEHAADEVEVVQEAV